MIIEPTSKFNLESISLKSEIILARKSNKKIEIVVVPKLKNKLSHQKNVGIKLDEKVILTILSNHYSNVIVTQINTQNDLNKLLMRKPDLVLSGVKYFNFGDKELWLNDFLDLHKIAYIASSRKALDCESDKSRAKDIVQKAGIMTAQYFSTSPGEHANEASIPLLFPLFVKPITGGDSRGIDANSIVNDFKGFVAKVDQIDKTQDSRCIVETYLAGKEYSVGIFQNSGDGELITMPIEIIAEKNRNGQRILDFSAKSNNTEAVIAVIDNRISVQLSNIAKAAFLALGGKAFGRIDIKMNHNSIPHFVEANLMPGLLKGYFYRSCLINLKLSYEEMIIKITDNALSNNKLS